MDISDISLNQEYVTPLVRLIAASLAGAVIGMERTYHGRPAGFRTHSLVATASSLLMLFTVFQFDLLNNLPVESVRVDPTRMAQGILTGIGFLGAGVIVREGITIRGLTTAASIWLTAAIGILIGVGSYFAAGVAEVLAIGILSVFGRIESRMPTHYYARLTVRFLIGHHMREEELRKLIGSHDMSGANSSYAVEGERQFFQYEMTIRTRDPDNFARLADTLQGLEEVHEFRIVPTRD